MIDRIDAAPVWRKSDFTLDEQRWLVGFFEAGATEADRMLDGYLAVHGGMLAEGWAPLEAERRILRFSRECYEIGRNVQLVMGCPATVGDRDGAAVRAAPKPFLVSEAGKRIVRARLDQKRLEREKRELETKLETLDRRDTKARELLAEKNREIAALREELEKSERTRTVVNGRWQARPSTRRVQLPLAVPELAPGESTTIVRTIHEPTRLSRLLTPPHTRKAIHLLSCQIGRNDVLPMGGLPAWIFNPFIDEGDLRTEILRHVAGRAPETDGYERLDAVAQPGHEIRLVVENRDHYPCNPWIAVLLGEAPMGDESGFDPLGISKLI